MARQRPLRCFLSRPHCCWYARYHLFCIQICALWPFCASLSKYGNETIVPHTSNMQGHLSGSMPEGVQQALLVVFVAIFGVFAARKVILSCSNDAGADPSAL